MTEPTPTAADFNPRAARMTNALFGAVIFLSAYLLFQVQPLSSKSILPWFGGTPSVWTTCMLFFQLLLFAGYAYAHVLSTRLAPRLQLIVHLVLIVAALGASVLPGAHWKPTGTEDPVLQIILMLGASIGLPFFVLSSTGPLVQNWFSRALSGRSPYHLYALSNAGSMLGLLLYPFAVERLLDLPGQAGLWRTGFWIFAIGCVVCGLVFAARTSGTVVASVRSNSQAQPPLNRRLLWFMLAATPSVMLLATTNQVCLDVASIPFLWVLPLTLYLLTFILAFAGDRWYFRRTCACLLPVSLVATVGVMVADAAAGLEFQVVAYFAALFLTAMCCHGELVRNRPDPQHLTSFYLWMSAGGAAGGVFVGVVAPSVFDLYLELHVAILLTLLLMAWIWAELPQRSWRELWKTPGIIFLSLAVTMTLLLREEVKRERDQAVLTMRNFYGVLRVKDEDPGTEWHLRKLLNGRILHGTQLLDPDRRRWPTTYYVETSGVGLAMKGLRPFAPRRFGLVGLGTGTLAAYGKEGDHFTYYEIDSDVLRISAAGAITDEASQKYLPGDGDPTWFSFIADCPAEVEVVLGDARLALERSEPQALDILVLDAFSSDAIPAHLLTAEAVAVYLKHLRSDGILAVHISNRHFDLNPVVAGLAEHFRLVDRYVHDYPDDYHASVSEWILLSRDAAAFEGALLQHLETMDRSKTALWTDAYSDLVGALRDKDLDSYKRDVDSFLEGIGRDAYFFPDDEDE